jgi:hypothetical protein
MIYVIGASVAGMLLAEQLHRNGRSVTLLTGGLPESKRLVEGCSLRRSTVDAFEIVFRTGNLWAELGGAKAEFKGLWIETMAPDGRRMRPRVSDVLDEAIGLSTRHGHILSVLRRHLTVPTIDGFVRDVVDGKLVLDQRALPIDDLVLNTLAKPFARPPRHATRYVIAAQFPAVGDLAAVAYGPILGRHLGFITPFSDPATPKATHYLINSTITTDVSSQLQEEVETTALSMATAYGLEPVELDATIGRAVIPIVERFDDVTSNEPRLFNLSEAFSPGVPAVNVDGMLGQAWGAVVLANNIGDGIHGALVAVGRHLREMRFWNKQNVDLVNGGSTLVRTARFGLMKPLMPTLLRRWAYMCRPQTMATVERTVGS